MGMSPGGYGAIIGGAADHIQNYIGDFGPAAIAQKREGKKQMEKLRTGAFGQSEAQKQGAYAQVAGVLAGQSRQQNADIVREKAAGTLSGSAAADATQAAVAVQQNAAAQAAGQIQASSDAQARGDYANALNVVSQQANRFRAQMSKQGQISETAANGAASGMGPATSTQSSDRAALLGNREGV